MSYIEEFRVEQGGNPEIKFPVPTVNLEDIKKNIII